MFAIIDDFELAAATLSVLFVLLQKDKSKRQKTRTLRVSDVHLFLIFTKIFSTPLDQYKYCLKQVSVLSYMSPFGFYMPLPGI